MADARISKRRSIFVASTIGVVAVVVGGVMLATGGGKTNGADGSSHVAAGSSSSAVQDTVGTSAAPGASSQGSTASRPAAPVTPPGPHNTDPSYTPPVLGTAGTDQAARQTDMLKMYVPPVQLGLPVSWQPGGWYAQVASALAVSAQTSTYEAMPGSGQVSSSTLTWQADAPGGPGDLHVSASTDTKTGRVMHLECGAQGFHAAAPQAQTGVLDTLKLCTGADFAGNDARQAAAWVGSQASLMLSDLARMGPGESVNAATPVFGSAVYWLNAQQDSAYGATINLTVYGARN